MLRRPKLPWVVLAHVGLVVLVAIVLYPVMLVCKKAVEPGHYFALSASPIPSDVTADHFRDLFTARGGSGELLFLRHTLNSIVVALLTTFVGVSLSCTAAYALSRFRFPGRKAGLSTFLVVQTLPPRQAFSRLRSSNGLPQDCVRTASRQVRSRAASTPP